MSKVQIGLDAAGKSFSLDIPTLIETRLLAQANSGGGKSWLLRKILEQTHGHVQQIIIDLEGEFLSLREKYDYLIVGKDGDISIDLKIANILPKKLLEAGISTIIDVSELKQHERKLFVKRFLEQLLNLPKKYWKPLIVVVDETHNFSPEKGNAESGPAVIDVATRGRKRGYCLIAATQRLSKLSKDCAAELNNVLIGRTGLDVDMKRAAEILGFGSKSDMLQLRTLKPGTFFAFGPAFPDGITLVTIGDVETSHPKVGSRSVKYTPTPTAKVTKILEQLKDLQSEASKELHEVEDFKAEIKSLRTQLTFAKKGVDKEALYKQAYDQAFKKVKASTPAPVVVKPDKTLIRDLTKAHDLIGKHLEPSPELRPTPVNPKVFEQTPPTRRQPSPGVAFTSYDSVLRPGAKRMLTAAAQFHPKPISRAQMSFLSGISVKGGSFSSYLSNLRTAGYIEEAGGDIMITTPGLEHVGSIPPLPSGQELVDYWCQRLRPGAERMLRAVVERYPEGIGREELGEISEVSVSGGSFSSYLSNLRTNNLITGAKDTIKAHPELMMEVNK